MKRSDWLWLIAFAALWCALRVFWIDADPGIASLWEYGFNATDEGYYMGAAKDKFVWGAFCDFARNESFTYGYSALTHWMAYIGYAICGLTDWGWRIPFVALYLLAWLMAFAHVTRRTSAKAAFLWCASLSSIPVIVAYERTACNDLTIGALAVIAFCLASGKGWWRIIASAFVACAISLIKPSVWILLPVVAAGLLAERKTRSRLLDIGLLVVAVAGFLLFWRLMAIVSVLPEAEMHGVSAGEILRRTTTHNALPSLFDFDQLFRGFSSFPRDICMKAFASATAIFFVAPLAMAARAALRRKWDWRLLLYISVPVYVAGVSVNNSICLHYYHPALMLMPLLVAEICCDLNADREEAGGASWKVEAAMLGIAAIVAALCCLAPIGSFMKPADVAEYYSTISNLPRKIVWLLTPGSLAMAPLAVVALIAVLRGIKATVREGAVWFAVCAAAASAALAGAPGAQIASYIRQTQSEWILPAILSLVASFVFAVAAFGMRPSAFRRRLAILFAPVAIAMSFAVSPTWRESCVQLLSPGTHTQRAVADEIAALVPANSVVIGERSSQVLMGKAIKTATTMPGCDPIPIVKALLERDGNVNLFALADSQNAYNLQHFQKHAKEYRLHLLKEFKMRSFANAKPASVYFCKIIPLKGER